MSTGDLEREQKPAHSAPAHSNSSQVPEPFTALEEAHARAAPRERGVYAAWITDGSALADAALETPAPRLVYVGKASGREGLRHRLLRHARTPFWDLLDLLAARGTIVPGWWRYADKHQPFKRSLHVPPLASRSEAAALAWQHEHLRWGWLTHDTPGPLEVTLIAAHTPLLNLSGKGLKRSGPPQMRMIGEWEAARAAWLFSVSWIAVLCARPDDWIRRRRLRRSMEVSINDDGWPVPLDTGYSTHEVTIPTERTARGLLHEAARDADLPMVFNDDEEASAWWAAYAGLRFRPQQQSVEAALVHALHRRVTALDMPTTLPSAACQKGVLPVIRELPAVVH